MSNKTPEAERLIEKVRRNLRDKADDHPPADYAAAERSVVNLLAAHDSLSSFANYTLARSRRTGSTREDRYTRARTLRVARQQTQAIAAAVELIAEFQHSGNASAVFRRGEAALGGDAVRLSTMWSALQSDERLRELTSSLGLSTSVSDSIDELLGSFDREVRIDQEGIHISKIDDREEQLLVDNCNRISGGLLVGLARGATLGILDNSLPAGIMWTRPGAPITDGQDATMDVISLVEALQHSVRKELLNDLKVQQTGERPIAEGQFLGIVLVVALLVVIAIGIFAGYKCAKDNDSDWCTVGLVAFLIAAALGVGFDQDLDKKDPGMPETDVETQPIA